MDQSNTYKVTTLKPYTDDRNNEIRYAGDQLDATVNISFRGSNNLLIVDAPSRLRKFTLAFDCSNSVVHITKNTRKSGSYLDVSIRMGEKCRVDIGKNVTTTSQCYLTAAEGTTIEIGNDCMLASGNEIRTHDGHPIFDVRSGLRSNISRSIAIGNHVWLAKGAVVLSGASVGDGSVIGFRSVVTRSLPNNCVAVGTPAKVAKRNIAWERPNLTLTEPYFKPDSSSVKKSPYWHYTQELEPVYLTMAQRSKRKLKHIAKRVFWLLPEPIRRLIR